MISFKLLQEKKEHIVTSNPLLQRNNSFSNSASEKKIYCVIPKTLCNKPSYSQNGDKESTYVMSGESN